MKSKFKRSQIKALLFVALLAAYAVPTAYAQYQNSNSTMQQLENAVDQIDTPQAWSQTPVAEPAVMKSAVRSTPVAAQSGMLSRRQIMRTFMEDDSTNSNSTNGSAAATSQCYSYYQTAATQEQRAYGYGNQARYDTDSYSRHRAASTADYAARACESAASSAYSASQYGDSQARSYAGKARGCANRARSAANTAKWYADAGQ